MTNAGYTHIRQYRDVESLNYYKIMLQDGKSEAEALEILRQRSRDNGRTPMQWSSGRNAGFSDSTPWIQPPDNYTNINAEAEAQDTDSILYYYKQLIRLRKESRAVSDGKIAFLCEDSPEIIAYRRFSEEQELLALHNFTNRTVTSAGLVWQDGWRKILGNYPAISLENGALILRPYEAVVVEVLRPGMKRFVY